MIDASTNTIVDTIWVGRAPFGVAVSVDAKSLYVTRPLDNTLSVVDIASRTVTTNISLYGWPASMSLFSSQVYAANRVSSGLVSVVDAVTNASLSPLRVHGSPTDIAVAPDGASAYVTSSGANCVSVIDVPHGTVPESIRVADRPGAVAVSPNGRLVYVASSGSDTISVIDVATNTLVGTIGVGPQPTGIAFTPDGAIALVANGGSGSVSVVDVTEGTTIATVPVEDQPMSVAITPDGTLAYVTNEASDSVSVIDTIRYAVTATIPVANAPAGIAIADWRVPTPCAGNQPCTATPTQTRRATRTPTFTRTSTSTPTFCTGGIPCTPQPTLTVTATATPPAAPTPCPADEFEACRQLDNSPPCDVPIWCQCEPCPPCPPNYVRDCPASGPCLCHCSLATPSPTRSPTPTPTSCTGQPPIVDPVMPTTAELEQTITGCGRFGGEKRVEVYGGVGGRVTAEAGSCGGCQFPQTCFQATVTLAPGQTHQIVVCQDPGLNCGPLPDPLCVSVDRNGAPLTIQTRR